MPQQRGGSRRRRDRSGRSGAGRHGDRIAFDAGHRGRRRLGATTTRQRGAGRVSAVADAAAARAGHSLAHVAGDPVGALALVQVPALAGAAVSAAMMIAVVPSIPFMPRVSQLRRGLPSDGSACDRRHSQHLAHPAKRCASSSRRPGGVVHNATGTRSRLRICASIMPRLGAHAHRQWPAPSASSTPHHGGMRPSSRCGCRPGGRWPAVRTAPG